MIKNFYNWLIRNLPFRLMYKSVYVNSKYKIWVPRWGWSKKQKLEAEKRAKDYSKNIKWE